MASKIGLAHARYSRNICERKRGPEGDVNSALKEQVLIEGDRRLRRPFLHINGFLKKKVGEVYCTPAEGASAFIRRGRVFSGQRTCAEQVDTYGSSLKRSQKVLWRPKKHFN